jgi:hypothetical protein
LVSSEKENPSVTIDTNKFPVSVMIFAIIGIDDKSKLRFVDGSINSEKYIQNIADIELPEDLNKSMDLYDGFSSRTDQLSYCRKQSEWLESNLDLSTNWSSNSPDLLPIELI